jgi:two-component system, NtrC family, sensor histidine kinase HydH
MTHRLKAASPPPVEESTLVELKRFVGFDARDELELAGLRDAAEGSIDILMKRLADRIGEHDRARAVLSEPEVDRGGLRDVVRGWLGLLLGGPWDESYRARRLALRETHIERNLPQHVIQGMYNLVRRWLVELAFERHAADPQRLRGVLDAIERAVDLDAALMLEIRREDLLARIKRHERLAMLGELSAGIHHELKNPLAAIAATVFALQERRTLRADPRARELLNRVRANVVRSNEIVGRMLSLTRVRDPALGPAGVEGIVERALAHCRAPAGVRLTVDVDPALPDIEVDSAQVEQVLLNLLDNAFHACREGGDVRILGRLADGAVQIAVVDDGTGVKSSDVRRVFEPLFSTKPEGTGLGLALGRRLVEANGGTITLVSDPGRGTTVTLTFPR